MGKLNPLGLLGGVKALFLHLGDTGGAAAVGVAHNVKEQAVNRVDGIQNLGGQLLQEIPIAGVDAEGSVKAGLEGLRRAAFKVVQDTSVFIIAQPFGVAAALEVVPLCGDVHRNPNPMAVAGVDLLLEEVFVF